MKLLKFILLILAHAILVGVPLWSLSKKIVFVDSWLLLSMTVSYDYYVAQWALLANVTVAILAIIVSSIADRILINTPEVINNMPRINISMSGHNHMQKNILSLAIGIRLLLVVFLGMFFYSTIMALAFSISGVVIGIDPISAIFLIFFPINIIASFYIIVFEPWRSAHFTLLSVPKTLAGKINVSSNEINKSSTMIIFALGRVISYTFIYMLLTWFATGKNVRDYAAMFIPTAIFLVFVVALRLSNRKESRSPTSKV